MSLNVIYPLVFCHVPASHSLIFVSLIYFYIFKQVSIPEQQTKTPISGLLLTLSPNYAVIALALDPNDKTSRNWRDVSVSNAEEKSAIF